MAMNIWPNQNFGWARRCIAPHGLSSLIASSSAVSVSTRGSSSPLLSSDAVVTVSPLGSVLLECAESFASITVSDPTTFRMSSRSFRTFLYGGSFASNRLSLISHLLHCIKNTLILTASISTARRPLCLLLRIIYTPARTAMSVRHTCIGLPNVEIVWHADSLSHTQSA